MKLHIIKFVKVIVILLFIFFNTAGLAKACTPDVVGRVVTNTGAPVAYVWVRWTDYRGNIRYEQTDSNGSFFFPIWTYLGDEVRGNILNNSIDTNLDGGDDTKQAVLTAAAADDLYKQFECGSGDPRVGHAFAVVPTVTLSGSFTSISGLNFNCGKGTYVLEDLVFTPSGPPPNPTPTPVGLTTKVVNFGIVPASGISGNVFIDDGRSGGVAMNGIQDGGEEAYKDGTGVTIIGTIYKQAMTGSDGTFAFPGIPDGNYTIFVTLPPNYHSTNETNKNLILPPGQSASFGIVSSYTIKGNVYNDEDKDYIFDPGELKITNAEITSTGGFVLTEGGYYEVQDLIAGTYTISFTSALQKGFYYLYPKPPIYPATYQVTVGAGCSADFKTGGSCVNDSVVNLNFAISDSWPWLQTYGLDVRFDDGFTNILPASTLCGGGSYASGVAGTITKPGIIFSGNGSSEFGQGSASTNDWVVGGASYPEVLNTASSLKTSTQNILSAGKKAGIPKQSLESYSTCNNPDNSCNLQDIPSDFYHTTGDININQSADFSGGNYVIIADGTINITNGAKLTVDKGSTLIVAAGVDIIVDSTIHALNNVCPVSEQGQLQGIYTANRHFIVEGNDGDCTKPADKMLNIDGALIVNANDTGGKFQNERDLCVDNRSKPSITIKARPDFILNTPGFLTKQQTISHEDTP